MKNLLKNFKLQNSFVLMNLTKKYFSFKVNDFLKSNNLERGDDGYVETDLVIVGKYSN